MRAFAENLADTHISLRQFLAGEIFDLDLTKPAKKKNFLQHQRNSFIRIEPSKAHLTRRALGSVRRSRMTPPLKNRRSIHGEMDGGGGGLVVSHYCIV